MQSKNKRWISPKVTVHGSIEEITQQNPKRFGLNDSYFLDINQNDQPDPGEPTIGAPS